MSLPIVLALLAGIIIFAIGMSKKGSTTMSKPSRILSFTDDISIDKATKIIINFANQSKYRVDDFDESKKILILSDETTLLNSGFIYPVYLTQNDKGQTIVEVGIKSKTSQLIGLDTPHENCFNGIRTAIFASK